LFRAGLPDGGPLILFGLLPLLGGEVKGGVRLYLHQNFV
jgi:hypothetical protein